MKRVVHLLVIGSACTALLGAAGCGGDDKASTEAKEAKSAPESKIAPDAEVASGLTDLKGVADGISKLSDKAASKKASDGLEPVWMKVEGTVKKNEPDMYATIEEDLSLLESGDQAKTKSGATELSKTVDEYLAKHPA
jgi:hypothetical protein